MTTLLGERTFGMQILHERAGSQFIREDAQVEMSEFERFLLSASRFLLKLLLVTMVSLGFLYTASFILAAASGVLFKVLALALWACGFVPVSCYLWKS